jgi:hypothetical protein
VRLHHFRPGIEHLRVQTFLYLRRTDERGDSVRQLEIALQALVHLRALHDHSSFREVSHFLQGKRRPQHVLRELLAPLALQFRHVAIGALIRCARARVAREMNTAFGRSSRDSRTWLAAA